MTTNDDRAIRYCLQVLRTWMAGHAVCPPSADVEPAVFVQLVSLNRLDALMGRILDGVAMPENWGPFLAGMAQTYKFCLVRNVDHLSVGDRAFKILEEHSVPALAVRGPFSAAGLYGDVGVRCSEDLDLFVPRRRRDEALKALLHAGWVLRNPSIPPWFYRRHHLHWPLRETKSGVLFDVHWAVDHPYKLHRINYDEIFHHSVQRSAESFTWHEPRPEHLLLISAAHLEKECRNCTWMVLSDARAGEMLKSGRLLQWLDIAAILKVHGPTLDWREVLRMAVEWKLERSLSIGVIGALSLYSVTIPEALLGALRHALIDSVPPVYFSRIGESRWATRFGMLGSFRGSVVSDLFTYLFAPRDHFGDARGLTLFRKRATHFVRSLVRVLRAVLDAAVCEILIGLRSLRIRRHWFRSRAEEVAAK